MPGETTALILVGGEARRSGGKEKYFFSYKGRSFISHLVETLSTVVDEIIIVARDDEQCGRFSDIPGIMTVADEIRGIGPLGGIIAGVAVASHERIFITACDMPCIRADIVRYLFDELHDADAAVPSWNEDMFEPLHAVYRRSAILDYLASPPSYSIRKMVWSIHTRFIPINELRAIDPELVTFTNINDLADLEAINGTLP
ncbi:molybdopterin-guanine dinucleotide biosynthesis protein A [Methanocalculus chunghsingensis]|uniref:Probable molybdenum cofactor guanylyltransferase n=1 Tax=Methanocalculus chunghsingensis TaxID=156457 RepID=A0A8J7W901_9EURY|nr:molybdenum cofactor guanylyltransferase [Methanocalculus chunghsingensis]MBR1368418.1 molybdopterin-guanine dinucleotide biosynthesis protein A [Methanocalculus chunghsingensis]